MFFPVLSSIIVVPILSSTSPLPHSRSLGMHRVVKLIFKFKKFDYSQDTKFSVSSEKILLRFANIHFPEFPSGFVFWGGVVVRHFGIRVFHLLLR